MANRAGLVLMEQSRRDQGLPMQPVADLAPKLPSARQRREAEARAREAARQANNGFDEAGIKRVREGLALSGYWLTRDEGGYEQWKAGPRDWKHGGERNWVVLRLEADGLWHVYGKGRYSGLTHRGAFARAMYHLAGHRCNRSWKQEAADA